jgi:hypothetical protein
MLFPHGFCGKKPDCSQKKPRKIISNLPGQGLGRGDQLFLSMRPDTRKTQRGQTYKTGKY